MKRSKYYDLRLPERGAREGEANDPADIEDLTYDFGLVDAELERQRLEDARLERDKASRTELAAHTGSKENPHGVTAAQAGAYTKAEADAQISGAVKAHAQKQDNPHAVTKEQVGLGNVPNVATDDQTPTYAEANAPAALSSGETLRAAFGKLAAAVTALLAHLADGVRHITAVERGAWNGAADAAHAHANKALLDGVTSALVTNWNAAHAHVSDTAKHVTAAERSAWNGKTATGFSRSLTSGTKIGTLTIDGTATDLYCEKNTSEAYSNMVGATASAAGKAGLVPAPAAGAQGKYLRGDGTWQTPPNTTYGAATQSAAGLMSAADKKKLDGMTANTADGGTY